MDCLLLTAKKNVFIPKDILLHNVLQHAGELTFHHCWIHVACQVQTAWLPEAPFSSRSLKGGDGVSPSHGLYPGRVDEKACRVEDSSMDEAS